MRFKKTNTNPTKKKKGDCVIRALSIALEKEWLEVYDELCKIGRKVYDMPSCKEVYETYLNEFESITPKVIKGKKRLTANDFKKGTYILSQANHLVAIKEGVLCDLWDSRKRCVYKYWIIKEVTE
jgi:hypothetical protein